MRVKDVYHIYSRAEKGTEHLQIYYIIVVMKKGYLNVVSFNMLF